MNNNSQYKQSRSRQIDMYNILINLHISKDSLNKLSTRNKTNSTTQTTQTKTNQNHITKVKTSLKQTIHGSLKPKVIQSIQKYVHGCRRAREECIPLPMIVFGIEAEVCGDDGCHGDNDDEDCVHSE